MRKFFLKKYNPVYFPRELYLTGETITFAGCWNKLNVPQGANIVKLTAEGGSVYYAINAIFASTDSPGYIADGSTRTLGPMANLSNIYVNAESDVIVHVRYYTDGGTSEVEPFTYAEKVLNYCPIAYWPLWETEGAVAQCLVNPAQNGAYTGVMLGQPGIGDGRTSPFFDGTNDFVDIYSAVFRDAFNGAEGTWMAWARVNGVGVWTDGARRDVLNIFVDGANFMYLIKAAANNVVDWSKVSGGVAKVRQRGAVSATGWIHLAMTWSEAGDVQQAYFNGVAEGVALVGLGVWAGVPIATNTLIGASSQVPVGPWHGNIAHVPIFDRALPPAAIADLATV